MTRMFVVSAVMMVMIASAETAVTLERGTEGDSSIQLSLTGSSWFLFTQLDENDWLQTYAGLIYSPTSWCQAGLGAGTETGEHKLRLGGWLWLGQGSISLLHLQEGGSGGPWHRTLLEYAVDERLSLGIINRAFYGRGAIAEYGLGRDSKATIEWYGDGAFTIALSHSF